MRFRLSFAAVCCVMLLLPAVSQAGLAYCPTASTSAQCVPTVPETDQAAIFDSFGITVSGGHRTTDRQTVNVVRDALRSEHYTVTEREGPGGYAHPQVSEFVAMAKKAKVIFISSHGLNPAVEGRDCKAAKALFVDRHDQGSAEISCAPQAGLLVQPEATEAEAAEAYDAYREERWSNRWIAPIAAHDLSGHGVFGVILTADGIRHFFGTEHLALVIDDACKSMSFASDFNAKSYFGYQSTACDTEDLATMQTLFDRLTGKSGIEYRNTTEAFDQGGFASPVFSCACNEPVVLSPAVLDAGVDPAVTLSPMSPSTREVTFDAKMADRSDVIQAEGCGAEVSNEKWTDDGTTLEYDLKLADTPSSGTDAMTLTISHDKAVGDPGGFPNQELDGNQNPSPDNGEAPNQSNYVVQKIPCATVWDLRVTGSQDGESVDGYVVAGDMTCDDTTGNYQLVHWDGAVPSGTDSETWVNVAGQFDTPLGTGTFGSDPGDWAATFNWLNPYINIGTTSGTIDHEETGGTIDATFGDGGGPFTIVGSWTCPSTGVA